MLVKIETEVTGNFTIESDMKVLYYPFEIDIRFDKATNIHIISICKKIINYSKYLPKIEIKNQKPVGVTLPPQIFLEEQIQILQHIESFGAIDLGVEKINWQNYSIEWIPETKEEHAEISVIKYNRKSNYELEPKVFSKEWLSKTIFQKTQLHHLALPFSFYREGVNLYHNFQYQNSFINFYLMLEGFFGNGQIYNNGTAKADFKKSDILQAAMKETIHYLEKTKGRHYEWLSESCKGQKKNLDNDGIGHLLVEKRGKLSHFSMTNSGKLKNPFKDREYESLAYIAMIICMYSSIKLRNKNI